MLINKLQAKIQAWNEKMLHRVRHTIQARHASKITLSGKEYLDFSNNDYLGLTKNSDVIQSILESTRKYGFGSGASSMVSGFFSVHQEVEQRFAEWLGVDKAILFNSGYLANIGVMSVLASRSDSVLSDRFCHASILDGIRLSRAKHYRYAHNDVVDLENLSKKINPSIIVTESVFSMEGDIAPLKNIINFAEKCQAIVVVDDAHGIGVLGENGKGIFEYTEISQRQIDCLIIPLGKAFNALGCIVAGKKEIIDCILQFAGTYRYTTALPPVVCSGILKALDIVSSEQWRRDKLNNNIAVFNKLARDGNLEMASDEVTPIRSVLIRNNEKAMKVQKKLLVKGFVVSCVRPPTVPENTARIRISLNCLHTTNHIEFLIDSIKEAINDVED